MARPATGRRPSSRRPGPLDRPARRHVPTEPGPTAPPGLGSAADGPRLPATPGQPTDDTAAPALTPAAFWALLPADDRERLGRRLSQLVLQAVRPPAPAEDC
jgi:hypothetical protein